MTGGRLVGKVALVVGGGSGMGAWLRPEAHNCSIGYITK